MTNDVAMTAEDARSPFIHWLPVVLWGLFIFTMSTSSFSAFNTSRFIEPMLRWFFPLASRETIGLLHALVRKSAHFTEYAVLF
jgi:hypothetical protein